MGTVDLLPGITRVNNTKTNSNNNNDNDNIINSNNNNNININNNINESKEYKMEIIWMNIFKLTLLHLLALGGLITFSKAATATHLFSIFCIVFSGMGITMGAHRLWAHRSYKATLPLKLLLLVANTVAMQTSVYVWVRDHRVHHKFTETDGDPHNAARGFFFAHMGWLMVRKHPEVTRLGSKIDLSDLTSDKMIMFQHRHYIPLTLLACIILPTIIPWYFWGEDLLLSYLAVSLRYVFLLHVTWLVNSAAHMYGERPYDVNINPAENWVVSLLAGGEGFHNYHHTFPSDYSTSEWRYSLNLTTFMIDFFAFLGLAYDRRFASEESVQKRMKRTGNDKRMEGEIQILQGDEKEY